MTASPTVPAVAGDRDPDLIVAHAHLRLGSLGLARAELETLAGRDRLDDAGIRDLAEARWRTGDVAGAGEAAVAYLETDADDVLTLVIAAEAQVDLGRPAEARRLVGRALERADGSLDPIFAGMKRSSIWPADGGAAAAPVGVLFDDLHPSPIATDAAAGRRTGDRHPSAPHAAPHAPLDPALPSEIDSGPGLWDDQPPTALGDGAGIDADALFHSARSSLEGGGAATAAAGFILALRAAPQLAPAVLDLVSGRSEPILVLVRGDAQRIVGRELESMRDHRAAASRVIDEAAAAPSDEPELPEAAQGGESAAGDDDALQRPSEEPADDTAIPTASAPPTPTPTTPDPTPTSIDPPSQEAT
ncbi:MAG TPA: hypothetical protein VIK65_13280 [Candidatus Limnocylindrales bacterium]